MTRRVHSSTVYRLFAVDGTLLYIGISDRPDFRLDDHRQQKDWWRHVKRVTLTEYPTRALAEAAEAAAIQAERPLHNVVHNQDRTAERLLTRMGSISAEAQQRGWRRDLALPAGCGIEVGAPLAAWFKPMGCRSLAQMQLQVDGYLAAFTITKTGAPTRDVLVNLAREALGMKPFEDGICRGPDDGLWGAFWGTLGWVIIERRLIPPLIGAFTLAGHGSRLRVREVPDAFACKHSQCMSERAIRRFHEERTTAA